MDILVKLFGSGARVKVLRIFLFKVEEACDLKDIVSRARVTPREVKKELALLLSIGLIKRKVYTKDVEKKVRGKITIEKVKTNGYCLDEKFPYLLSLKNLLITVSLHDNNDLIERFSKVGRVKLLIASGVFIQDWESRVDLLLVGDGISTTRLETAIRTLESELGKEIRYSVFETPDFEYRVGIYDKLVRDILDFPHTTLIDKLGVEGQ